MNLNDAAQMLINHEFEVVIIGCDPYPWKRIEISKTTLSGERILFVSATVLDEGDVSYWLGNAIRYGLKILGPSEKACINKINKKCMHTLLQIAERIENER